MNRREAAELDRHITGNYGEDQLRWEREFEAWLSDVDAHIGKAIGLCSADLPDCLYADWYDDGVTAKEAASRAIRNAGGESQ